MILAPILSLEDSVVCNICLSAVSTSHANVFPVEDPRHMKLLLSCLGLKQKNGNHFGGDPEYEVRKNVPTSVTLVGGFVYNYLPFTIDLRPILFCHIFR